MQRLVAMTEAIREKLRFVAQPAMQHALVIPPSVSGMRAGR